MKNKIFRKTILKCILKILGGVSLYAGLLVPTWADQADALFDESTVHEIHLTMDPDDWQELRLRYRENIWFPATFEWEGEVIEKVGIHSRGGAGTRSGIKPSLRVSFDRFVRGQRFLGLRSLVIKNMAEDTPMMRERLAMKIFQEQGFASPRVVHARLYVNEEYRGLYALIESVDKIFLESHFKENSGNLFKAQLGGYLFEWRGDDPGAYIPKIFKPQTNRENLDTSGLIGMIDAINNASDEEFIEAVDQYLDWNELLRYLSIENAIAELDGILGDWGINNFYFYQFDGGNRFTIIPWDKDDVSYDWPLSIFHNTDRLVPTRRAFLFPELRNIYLDSLGEAVTWWVKAEWLLPQIETMYRQIHQAVMEDIYKPYSNQEFDEAVQELVFFASVREAAVRGQIEEERSKTSPY